VLTPKGLLRYRLANTEFVISDSVGDSTPTEFRVRKSPEAITALPKIRGLLRFRNVLHVVDDDLGSVALTTLVGAPSAIVAVSTHVASTEALEGFAARRGIADRMHVHQGVSLDDGERLGRIVDEEFDGESGLEVVIDDVSDRLATGLQLFETLFPRLTAGGSYIIERWSLDHFILEGILAALGPEDRANAHVMRAEGVVEVRDAKGEVLEALLPMLVSALRARPDIVARIVVSQQSLAVTRGTAPIETPFRLSDIADGLGDPGNGS
jgi:hypothetical protein